METRNVLLAVILSTIVLVFWGTFFAPPPLETSAVQENQISENQDSSSPSIDVQEPKKEISRNDSIIKTKRVKIENNNIKGSISLEGAIIDDIVFKNYKENLNGEKKVTFLNPKNSSNEYFIETGWASGGNEKTPLPLNNSVTSSRSFKDRIYLSPSFIISPPT